jgi:hypothetical protein
VKYLVRSHGTQILRPMTRSEVIELIERKILGLQDEVCGDLGYWFALHEVKELDQHLQYRMESTLQSVADRTGEVVQEVPKGSLTPEAERLSGGAVFFFFVLAVVAAIVFLFWLRFQAI